MGLEIELRARFVNQKRRFENTYNDCIIGEIVIIEGGKNKRSEVKITVDKGQSLKQDLMYLFLGQWGSWKNTFSGKDVRQFQAKSHAVCAPIDERSVVAYLTTQKGIGTVTARQIWWAFKEESISAIRERPEEVAKKVPRLSIGVAREAAENLSERVGEEETRAALLGMLSGKGFPKQMVDWLIKDFGVNAPELIKKSPYRLLKYRGVGFATADAFYCDLGLPPEKMKRQALCIWNALNDNSGDTWRFLPGILKQLHSLVGGVDINEQKALRLAVRAKLVSVCYTETPESEPVWTGDFSWITTRDKADEETQLARMIAREQSCEWPALDSLETELSEHQFENLKAATAGPLGILGGSPGTGKTYTAANLCRLLLKYYEPHEIGIGAPTGKAAVRLTEVMHEYGLPLIAKTWHSLLGVNSVGDGGWHFVHSNSNPLPYKVLIGDEMSMLSADLACSVMSARSKETLMLWVGDIHQLPPVGHGAPLRDSINAGLPYGELTEIHRNSGGIVQACADIRDGVPFQCDGNLRMIKARPDEQMDAMKVLHESILFDDDDADLKWDVQVICAVNEKSPISRGELNRELQTLLNNKMSSSSKFWMNDKVANLSNGYFADASAWRRKNKDCIKYDSKSVRRNTHGAVYVANGEVGQVVEIADHFYTILLESPARAVMVWRKECNWDLGYALSCHKFQGSQAPYIIVMVDGSAAAKRVCSREFLYTAISRAKKECYLVGDLEVARKFTTKTVLDKRKTFLKDKIKSIRS